MSTTSKISFLIAACLATAPYMASANDNFPRQKDPSSLDHFVVVALEEIKISKQMLIAYGAYDAEWDPARWAAMNIRSRGIQMQHVEGSGYRQIYAMRIILGRVEQMEKIVQSKFKKKRGALCSSVSVKDERGESAIFYEALPGTSTEEAAMFCLEWPDRAKYRKAFPVETISVSGEGVACGYNYKTDGFGYFTDDELDSLRKAREARGEICEMQTTEIGKTAF